MRKTAEPQRPMLHEHLQGVALRDRDVVAADPVPIPELVDADQLRQRPLERFGILNMTFTQLCYELIGNRPLARISEQLYFLTSRIMLELTPPDRLEAEFDFFILEIREVLAALRIGDMEAYGYIRRAHLSMNVSRLMLYKQAAGEALPKRAAAV